MKALTQGATDLADRLGLDGPTLLVDRRRARRNLDRMVETARRHGLRLRPHFKTHQSRVIGRWFAEVGIDGITVSSLEMARAFARDGWTDITVAFPFNPRETDAAAALADAIDLGLLVSDPMQVEILAAAGIECGVWVKIDTGYGRAGVRWDADRDIAALAGAIREAAELEFRGILTHAGHSYHAGGVEAIRAVHARALDRMRQARSAAGGCPVSIGDTPGCSVADDFTGVDEIRPGNFIYYDLMQLRAGVCGETDIAAGVLCPVVEVRASDGVLVLCGGAVHLSKEFLPDGRGGRIYGQAARVEADGFGRLHPEAALVSLSQEHGLLKVGPEVCGATRPGDMVLILPVHSCLAANLHRHTDPVII